MYLRVLMVANYHVIVTGKHRSNQKPRSELIEHSDESSFFKYHVWPMAFCILVASTYVTYISMQSQCFTFYKFYVLHLFSHVNSVNISHIYVCQVNVLHFTFYMFLVQYIYHHVLYIFIYTFGKSMFYLLPFTCQLRQPM